MSSGRWLDLLHTLTADPWEPGDGTRWLYFPQFREWHGWVPGEDGLFIQDVAEFREIYPDAPSWEGPDA